MQRQAIIYALLSAALFGASTPLAKLLLGEVPPLLLAAILYLGSGIGLLGWIAARRAFSPGPPPAGLSPADYPWLGAAIVAGGVVAPLLLVFGLIRTDGSTASLLLNLEAVLTAVIAWVAFRENVDRRVFLGMMSIVAGGVLLAWQEAPKAGSLMGPALIGGACLAWVLMALGVRLHLTERHEHKHVHEPLEHSHPHIHDEHHQHEHEGGWDGKEPHTHAHRHARLVHSHPHYPDLHHRHDHQRR